MLTAYALWPACRPELIFAIHLMVLAMGLGYHLPVARIVPALIGALFVVIGNVMPLARSNFMFGIRMPWTLSNDRVWASTHRLAGYTITGAGFVMIATAALLPTKLTITVFFATIAAAVLGPAVYSYFTWNREKKA